MPTSKPVSFADFLEQTERKLPTRAESAPGAEITSHVEFAPDAEIASGTKFEFQPVRKVPDAKTASHAESAPVRGHLRLPNEIVYRTFPSLKPSEAIVLLRLYALSHGFQKDTCTVSLDTLASGCNLSRTQTRVCVRSLIQKRIVKSTGVDNTNSAKELRGLSFQVLLPSATRAESTPGAETASGTESAPNKVHTIKDTHTNTAESGSAPRVRVCSRFTLAECRRYAESLRRDGINNPGGYATKIHRSGEADDLIETFLSPVETSMSVDASLCPDCHGTGFWEPAGKGKGVAKCKHERLPSTQQKPN